MVSPATVLLCYCYCAIATVLLLLELLRRSSRYRIVSVALFSDEVKFGTTSSGMEVFMYAMECLFKVWFRLTGIKLRLQLEWVIGKNI